MAIEVPFSTVEIVHMGIRNEHPVNGEVDLSGETLQVALPIDGVAPSSWVSTTWETKARWIDGRRFWLAKFSLNGSGFALASGKTYRMYAKVGTGPVIVKGPTLVALAT